MESSQKTKLLFDHIRVQEESAPVLNPEEIYQKVVSKVQSYHPSGDMSLIKKAYDTACHCHSGQYRKSGEPYIIHPLHVALILAELELDKETLAAGLLHDVVEDSYMQGEELGKEFGPDVARLVDGVTKLEKLPLSGAQLGDTKLEMQAENLRKMFLAMAEDIRVVLIKLADRLHNMRTLQYKSPESQQRIAKETLDIYSPIAHRLGISKIKVELDDLSLKYLEPEVYYDLVDKIAIRKNDREAYIESIVEEVSAHIHGMGIEAKISGRVKHFFSIYKKMKNKQKSLDQIYDLFAVRILVNTRLECYTVLGLIHGIYKNLPGRFKDYISVPKSNMYQSLHTTLIGKNGQLFEIQIRTYEMHKAAEYGIAAHWKYKDAQNGKKGQEKEEQKMQWLREVLEWQKNISDNTEFVGTIKEAFDLLSENVYCLTPQGEVKSLPAGSTPIDFAYSIHSAVGNKMVGARANGRLVTINYVIQNGDRLEILTSQNSKGPSRDWLNIVKSTQARNKINQWFRSEYKEENIQRGRDLLQAYCKLKGVNLTELAKPDYVSSLLRKYGFRDWDAMLAAIGHGGFKEGQVVNRLQELWDRDNKKSPTDEEVLEALAIKQQAQSRKKPSSSGAGIVVRGMSDLSVRFSKCCSPVPGDEIVGFVTRGRGVSIHRSDCVNMMILPEEERGRILEAEWQGDTAAGDGRYVASIQVFAKNHKGLLADVSRFLSDNNINILSISANPNKKQEATMHISFEIGGREELIRILDKLRSLDGILDVERTAG